MTGPLDEFAARRFAQGIARTDVTVKQAYGRTMAVRLGFDPGPPGADRGVDGRVEYGPERGIFFCRLTTPPLGVKDAREFGAVLVRERATLGVALSAFSGYAPGFEPEVRDILAGAGLAVSLHLLRLQDVLAETAAFQAFRSDFPAA